MIRGASVAGGRSEGVGGEAAGPDPARSAPRFTALPLRLLAGGGFR